MSIRAAYVLPHPPIILPEIGRGEEKRIQKTIDAYKEVVRRIKAARPQTVIIASSHALAYTDYFHISPGTSVKGNLSSFRAPQLSLSVDYDAAFVNELCVQAKLMNLSAGTTGEKFFGLDHGSFIPLYFLQEIYADFRLVRLGLSNLSPKQHYLFGKCIAQTVKKLGRSSVFIASGDLSHKLKEDGPYGFALEGPEFDREITNIFSEGRLDDVLDIDDDFAEKAAHCGLGTFQIMAGLLSGKGFASELLSYEGPFGVGYAIAAFTPLDFDADDCAIKDLARASIEHWLKSGSYLELPSSLPEKILNQTAGVFVSIKKNGQLRGCIGTIKAVQKSIAEEIIHNAVSAAFEDTRFSPVQVNELPYLIYSVDILGSAEAIESPKDLNVKKYGVIVSSGMRRGLLLPNIDGVETVEEQLDIAKQKAGIGMHEKVQLQRFEVIRYQ